MRRIRLVITGLLAVALHLARAPDAAACDCVNPEPTAPVALQRGVLIAEGRVVEVLEVGGDAEILVTLAVTRAWKGAVAGRSATVQTSASNCGRWVLPGDHLLVYAMPLAGAEPVIDECSGGRVAYGADIAGDLAVLGPPRSEVAAPPVPIGPSPVAADLVIDGVVVQSRTGARRYEIEVVREVRGRRRREVVELETPVGACGVTLAVGQRVRVAARRVVGALVVTPCLPGTFAAVQGAR